MKSAVFIGKNFLGRVHRHDVQGKKAFHDKYIMNKNTRDKSQNSLNKKGLIFH